jgi:hypothetical protein
MGHNPKLAMQQQGPVQLNQQTCQSRSKTHQLKTVHRSKRRPLMSALGLVSRASPVQTAMRNCTRDEGGPFEVGNHGPISSRCKLLRSKAVVVSVAVKLGPKVQDGKVERGERKRTAAEVSKSD